MSTVFNRDVFQSLVADLGEADTIEVLGTFLADTSGKMTRLVASGDERSLIKREAHSIKSSAGTFGFDELSQLARGLEVVAESATTETLSGSMRELQSAFERARLYAQTTLMVA